MKKLIQILTVLSLMLALVPVAAFAHTADAPIVTDLTAGGGNIKSAKDFIAAHGVVQTGGADGLEAMLPDQVTISTVYPGLEFSAPSYFDITVSGGTTLDGTYDGYCVDTDGGAVSGTANVYSSYEPLPQTRIEYPENLDLVNWIINQGFEGQPSVSCQIAHCTSP